MEKMTDVDFRKLILNIISEWLFVEKKDKVGEFTKNRLFEPNEYIIRSLELHDNNFDFDQSLYDISCMLNLPDIMTELYKIYINQIKLYNDNVHLNIYKKLFKLFTFTPYIILDIYKDKLNSDITSKKVDKVLKALFSKNDTDIILDIYHYTTVESCNLIRENKTLRLKNKGLNDPKENEEIPPNIFIACFSLLKDHPTLWRLYGDNTKGVCMHFKLNISTISSDAFPFFILYDHKYFKNFIEKIEKIEHTTEMAVFLQTFKIITQKNIFYKDEHEIRIAYTDINPNPDTRKNTIDINLEDLGLELENVIKGCNYKKNILATLVNTTDSNMEFNIK